MSNLVPTERIEKTILLIRSHKVMIDADLASIYCVSAKRLREQIRRNKDRFPDDFMIQLSKEELLEVSAICGHLSHLKFSPTLPYAFTEHGAIMLASILNSKVAVQASIQVVRAFIRLREILATHKKLALKLQEHDKQLGTHDMAIRSLFETIRKLTEDGARPKRRLIGFGARK